MTVANSLIFRRFLNKFRRNLGSNTQSNHILSSKFYRKRAFLPGRPTLDFRTIKELGDAISMFRDMLTMKPMPSVLVFNKLLAIVVKMECCNGALYMFNEMRHRSLPVNGYTMTIVINCYCILNHVEFGIALLGSFFKRGFGPDTTTYTTLLKALFLADEVFEAEKLFNKVLRLKLCEPDNHMFSTVLNGLCKAGQTAAARDLLQSLEEGSWKLNIYAYNIVIDGLCKDKLVDDALRLFTSIIRKEIPPDVVTYSSVVHGLFRTNRFATGLELFHEMEACNVFPDVVAYNILLHGLCRNRRISKAFRVLEMMEANAVTPNIVSYNVLIDGLCRSGKIENARHLFDRLPSKGLKPNVITFNIVINAYFQSGMAEEARNLRTEMVKCGCVRYTVT